MTPGKQQRARSLARFDQLVLGRATVYVEVVHLHLDERPNAAVRMA